MSIEIRIENAIDYIEKHLDETIDINYLCNKVMFMSKSSFYVIFKSLIGTSIKDYIRKRRLSVSGYDLIHSDAYILDIALKYQYKTAESFSRAFKKHYGISPTLYRLESNYIEYFPAVSMTFSQMLKQEKGGRMLRQFLNKDKIAETLDTKKKGFILDIDLDQFAKINDDYSFEIGDKVLVEAANRIKAALIKNNLDLAVTRIGGDEFIVILEDDNLELAKTLAKDILDAFALPMVFGDTTLIITTSIGMSEFHRNINSKEAIDNASQAMIKAKDDGRHRLSISE